MAFDYPLINGTVPSWASLSLEFQHGAGTFSTPDFCSLDWNDKLEPGKVQGAGAAKRGRTRGEYDADAKIGMYLAAGSQFLKALATNNPSAGLVIFDIHCNWTEDDDDHEVIIIGARIKGRGNQNAPGSDATKIEFDLDVMRITVDGVDLLEPGK